MADVHNHPARLEGSLASVWREILADGDSAITESALREMLSKRGVDAELALSHAEEIGTLKRGGEFGAGPRRGLDRGRDRPDVTGNRSHPRRLDVSSLEAADEDLKRLRGTNRT